MLIIMGKFDICAHLTIFFIFDIMNPKFYYIAPIGNGAEGESLAEVKGLRINDQIRVREVRLIGVNGEQAGIVPTIEAVKMAAEAGLDLVEVAPTAKPPVCKIIDYGKYRFQMEKKLRDSKKNQKQQMMREIRMQPKIHDHDLEFKSSHIKKFLVRGDQAKVTMRFWARELAHTELGYEVLNKVLEKLGGEEACTLEKKPAMEGRTMSMTLSPKQKK